MTEVKTMMNYIWKKANGISRPTKEVEPSALEVAVNNFCEDCKKSTVQIADLSTIDPRKYSMECRDCYTKVEYILPEIQRVA